MVRSLNALLLLLTVTVALTGCPSNSAPPPAAPPAPAPAASSEGGAQVAVEDRVLPVKCGCKLEVKKCSEWAELDGQWVQLTGNHGLGTMPFCGKENLKARINGHLKDGKLHLTSIEMVQ